MHRSLSSVSIAAAAFVVGGACFWAAAAESVSCDDADEAAILQLQEQRILLLAQRQEAVQSQYDAGTGNLRELLDATGRVLEAKLETATRPEQRRALHRQTVELFEQLAKVEQERHEAGVARLTDFLEAQAALLHAQIGYLRECQNR